MNPNPNYVNVLFFTLLEWFPELIYYGLRSEAGHFVAGVAGFGCQSQAGCFSGCIYGYCSELCVKMGHNLSKQVRMLAGL